MLWVSLKSTLALVRICVCACAVLGFFFLRPCCFSPFLSLPGVFCVAKWLGTIAIRTRAYQQATGIDSLTSIHKLTHPTFFSKHRFSQYAVATSDFLFFAQGAFFSEYFGVYESLRAIDHGFFSVVVVFFSPSCFALEEKKLFTCLQYTYWTYTMKVLSIGLPLIRGFHSIFSLISSKSKDISQCK